MKTRFLRKSYQIIKKQRKRNFERSNFVYNIKSYSQILITSVAMKNE